MENICSKKDSNKYAWNVLLSFGFMYLFFYNGRQNINLVMTKMASDFNLTTTTIAAISSSLFWCYAFGQLINGRLGSYFGYKKIIFIGVVMSIIINIVISYQQSIIIITILWGLNGYFQSMVWANGIGVLNRWWKKEKRGFATGVATAFSGIAQIVTYFSVSLAVSFAPQLGWKAGFRYPVIPLIFMLIPFIFLFKESPEEDKFKLIYNKKIKDKVNNFFSPYKKLLLNPKMILFCFISSIAGIGRYGLLTWIPTYFMEYKGLSIKNGILSSILLPIGQSFAMFIFPYITDKLFKGKREPVLALASIVTFLCMIIFPIINLKTIASLILLIVGIFSMVTGIIWSFAGDIGKKENSSTAAGILDWAVYMGAAFQASMFGFIKDKFGWNAIFITIGCLYVLLFIITLISSRIKEEK